MKQHLKKLRTRPEHEKKKLVKVFAVIGTVLIVIIWIILRSLGSVQAEPVPNDKNGSFGDALNVIFTEGINSFGEIRQGFDEQETFEEIFEGVEQTNTTDDPLLTDDLDTQGEVLEDETENYEQE